MRIFLLVLVLIFSLQSWIKADDISEYEIEGMSIGDSLFEHFSKNVIENALDNKTYYKDKSFFEILDKKNSNFDFLQVALRNMINHIKLKKLCY